MKNILVAFLLFVAAAAGAQDAAQPAPKLPPASSQVPSIKDSATDDSHAGRRDFRMADGTSPEKMFFAQWEFILSKGSAADRKWVWDAIKGKTVQMRGTVIRATANQLDLAEAHNIDPRRADVALTFQVSVNAFPKQDVNFIPQEGASFDFQGVVSSYTRKPFMLIMEKGMLFLPMVSPAPTTADNAASH